MSSAPSKRFVSLAASTQPAHKKARQGLTFDEVVQHNWLCRIMRGSDADKAKFHRVTIYTVAGNRCGPAGLGKLLEDVDGAGASAKDMRLTVPGHYSPSFILSMQDWVRLATPAEMEEDKKWYRPIDTPKAIVIGKEGEGRVAPPDIPIGFEVDCATAIAQAQNPTWEDIVPINLEGVSTPVSPPSNDESSEYWQEDICT